MKKASTQFLSEIDFKLTQELILPVYKPVGLSPLEAIRLLKIQQPELANEKMGYAGRLDPLAEGLLLVLAGEANQYQEQLSHLDKRYSVSCILGITTDSYDLLGLPELSTKVVGFEAAKIEKVLEGIRGEIDQPYPPYSAVRVKGRPLFWWARSGRLDEIEIPTKIRLVNKIGIEGHRQVQVDELLQLVEHRVGLVQGDFRQTEILTAWRNLLAGLHREFIEVEIEIECSSGTYVRGLIHELGQRLGSGAVATRICRTRVGDYALDDPATIFLI